MADYLTADKVAKLWDRYSRDETSNALARRFGQSSARIERGVTPSRWSERQSAHGDSGVA